MGQIFWKHLDFHFQPKSNRDQTSSSSDISKDWQNIWSSGLEDNGHWAMKNNDPSETENKEGKL